MTEVRAIVVTHCEIDTQFFEIQSNEKYIENRILNKTILHESQATKQTCSRQTKARFGGMNASDAKKLRALEDEDYCLKQMLADEMLDTAALYQA
ncbi:hypothetical protein HRQ87_08190 [Sulfitobacter sp. 1151]|uniref:Uncharacterized protein n=1 Tax=Parasulfitobacter algicola TaxID=2614809 RepID=A0ABX2IPG6_9RHOB|nr:hypothetical protein [Sulfitobacter algicola]